MRVKPNPSQTGCAAFGGTPQSSTAVLSSRGELTSFRFGDVTIRFRTSVHLERYLEVRYWDKGYIEVMAKYDNSPSEEEEYIDLIPILRNLNFNPEEFLAPITNVEICYA